MVKPGGKSLKLPRSAILRGKKRFDALFAQGKTLYAKNINMRFRIFEDKSSECKMAFIAAKRLGNAVKRNTMKRRMREAYRIHQYILADEIESYGVGIHAAFMVKSCGVPYERIESDIISLQERLKEMLVNHRNKL